MDSFITEFNAWYENHEWITLVKVIQIFHPINHMTNPFGYIKITQLNYNDFVCIPKKLYIVPHLLLSFSLSLSHTLTVAKQQVVAYTQKSQVKHENRHIQLVREYGFHPRTKASVEDGDVLPRKFEPFPEHMYGKPLEEIDTFIYEEVSHQRPSLSPFV